MDDRIVIIAQIINAEGKQVLEHPLLEKAIKTPEDISELGMKKDEPLELARQAQQVFLERQIHTHLSRELRTKVASLMGQSDDDYTANSMTYDLRRLKMHGLIEKIPQTNRYVVTQYGLHSCLYLTKIYSRFRPSDPGKEPQA